MSVDPLVPAAVQLAAKRAFIATFFQALASVIPSSAITISLTADFWIGAGLGVANGLATAVLAGAIAYSLRMSNGIPTEYQDVALVKQAAYDPDEAANAVDTAVQRVILRRDLK